jgi:hypothetical protein
VTTRHGTFRNHYFGNVNRITPLGKIGRQITLTAAEKQSGCSNSTHQ